MDQANSEKAIIKTILYSDIFNFPLTKDELWQFLISKKKVDKNSFERALQKLSLTITQKDTFYCLNKRESIIEYRKKNIAEVQKKYRIAKSAAYYLSYIPTIYFIGISGSVAVRNVGKADDIDFFIITKKNTLFMTRVCILAVLEYLNVRRRRNEKNSANKICVNLLIEETALSWPSEKHDLFTAHEIVQMKPLFERNNMYKKFLASNIWVKKYFPNAFGEQQNHSLQISQKNYYSLTVISSLIHFLGFEQVSRFIQKYYMKRHKTTEIVKNNFLAFHPKDYRLYALDLLKEKIEQFGLLTRQ
jgi:hypothetical protein